MRHPALQFLAGVPIKGAPTLEWILLEASNAELERGHKWVQWAFPIDTPSRYNPECPPVRPEMLQNLSALQGQNLRSLLNRYMSMLAIQRQWRKAGDHNHKRLTRVLRCLSMVGWTELATEVYTFAVAYGKPTHATLTYWQRALEVQYADYLRVPG